MSKEKEIQEWIDNRPPAIREVANKYRPNTCYNATNNNGLTGHYLIHSYEENKDGTVTCKVNHLPDSFLPNFQVFGFKPRDLKKCGCLNRKANHPAKVDQ